MKSFLTFLPLLACAVLSAQVVQDRPPFAMPGSVWVNGEVLTTKGGEPAGGVAVAALAVPESNTVIPPGEAKIVAATQTNSFGRYSLQVPGFSGGARYFIAVGTYSPSVAEQLAGVVARSGGPNSATLEQPRNLFKIRGRVEGPIAGPGVPPSPEVRLTARNSLALNARVGPDRSFEFVNVPPGTYSLRVTPDASMEPVEVVILDKDVVNVAVVVPPRVRLSGASSIEEGAPLPSFALSFWDASVPNSKSISIKAGRDFSLQFPPGRYRVTASLAQEYVIKTATLSSPQGSIDLAAIIRAGDPIDLTAGDTRVAMTLAMSPDFGAKVSGRVTNKRGTRLGGSAVRISGAALADPGDATIAADGTFEFSKIPRGEYDLSIVNNVWAEKKRVVVRNEDVRGIEIESPPTKEVRGQLVIEGVSGIPSSDAWPVWFAINAGNSTFSEASNVWGTRGSGDSLLGSNGSFLARLPEKETRIQVVVGSAGYEVRAVEYGTVDALKDPIVLDAGPARLLRITLVPVRTFAVPIIISKGQSPRTGVPLTGPATYVDPPGTTSPELNRSVAPQLSDLQLRALADSCRMSWGPGLLAGNFWVRTEIGRDGMVRPGLDRSDVLRPSCASLLAQLEAIRMWEFKPATNDGAPIDAPVHIELRFIVE